MSASLDKTIRVWRDGQCTATLEGHEAAVLCLAQLPNGDLLSGSGDCTIRVWSGGKCTATIAAHSDSVRCVTVGCVGGADTCGVGRGGDFVVRKAGGGRKVVEGAAGTAADPTGNAFANTLLNCKHQHAAALCFHPVPRRAAPPIPAAAWRCCPTWAWCLHPTTKPSRQVTGAGERSCACLQLGGLWEGGRGVRCRAWHPSFCMHLGSRRCEPVDL